jgi:hypothetical protein
MPCAPKYVERNGKEICPIAWALKSTLLMANLTFTISVQRVRVEFKLSGAHISHVLYLNHSLGTANVFLTRISFQSTKIYGQ